MNTKTMSVNVVALVLIAAGASQAAQAAAGANRKEAVYITFDEQGCATNAIKLEDSCPNPQGTETICRWNNAASGGPNKVEWVALPKRKGAIKANPENKFTLHFAEPVCAEDDDLKKDANDKQKCKVVSPADPPSPAGKTIKYDVRSTVQACTDLDPFIIVRS